MSHTEETEKQPTSNRIVLFDQRTSRSEAYVDVSNTVHSPPTANASSNIDSSSQDNVSDEHIVQPNYYFSPNGTKYWIPIVPTSEKPIKDAEFQHWDDVVAMYRSYAEKAGFDIRISTKSYTKGVCTHRYIVCSRMGNPRLRKVDTNHNASSSSKQRNTKSKLTGCGACIRVKVKGVEGAETYTLYRFIEAHNHCLVNEHNMDLTRGKRQLNFSDKEFIHGLQSMGFGPTKAHRVQTALKGGQHLVRGTKNDWKNVIRDVRLYIRDRDAQMVINKFNDNILHLNNFYFTHLAEEGVLKAMFWADDISRSNYNLFGDVIAFDATYHTNRYSMIFVPFTGVDCHQKCVTFGAGLISNETIESYTWLLDAFIGAHPKQPKLVLTDQDPAMKQAVNSVFSESHHRLCMWHITEKIPQKLKGDIDRNNEIKSVVNKLVWNVFIKPETFEERWHDMLNQFSLHDNKWLSDMYAIRHQWVPAYFRELPMCCLMKTTSRCESSNSAFKVYSSEGNTLVQFMLCFEQALNAQRFTQRQLQYDTSTKSMPLLTHLPFEVQASRVYTLSVFEDVQKEIYEELYRCSRDRVETDNGLKVHYVTHNNQNKRLVGEFKVTSIPDENSFTCSCRLFTRIGYLCRHVFCVFKTELVDEIPDTYIPTRWRNDALSDSMFNIEYRYGVPHDEKSKLRHEFIMLTNECADRARGDIIVLKDMVEQMKQMKDKIWQEIPTEPSYNNKSVIIQDLLGVTEPETISITAPTGIRTKGSGTRKRKIGPGEKAKNKKKKHRRECKKFHKLVRDHDSRNCEKVRKAKELRRKQRRKKGILEDTSDNDGPTDDEVYESTEDDEDEEYISFSD